MALRRRVMTISCSSSSNWSKRPNALRISRIDSVFTIRQCSTFWCDVTLWKCFLFACLTSPQLIEILFAPNSFLWFGLRQLDRAP